MFCQNNCMNEIVKHVQSEVLAYLLKVQIGKGGRPVMSCTSWADMTVIWLMRIHCELKALASDQKGENYLEEVLLQKTTKL